MDNALREKLGIVPAQEQDDNSLLIVGMNDSGKTYQAVQVAQDFEKVLFIAFGANTLSDYEGVGSWDTITIVDWAQFEKILTSFKQGKMDYSCVVLDNYNLAFQLLAPEDAMPSQPEYGRIAVKGSTPINVLKGQCEQVIVTLNVIDHPLKGRKVDLTPRAENNIIGKFRHNWYTFATKGKGNDLSYKVQKESKLALNFIK